MHKEPAIAFANKGYHILLEKPMAPTLADCEEIVETCKRNKIMLAVGHVLRYKPHYLKVKEIIESGKIGMYCTVFFHSESLDCQIVYGSLIVLGSGRNMSLYKEAKGGIFLSFLHPFYF